METPSVCFIGDSITAFDKFTRILVDYFALHFPKKRIRFYNAAVPGASLETLLGNWDTLISPTIPTYATLLFGINDLKRALYAPSARPTPALIAKRAAAVTKYCENLHRACDRLPSCKILMLCPPPHEESPHIKSPLYQGLDAALMEVSRYICTNFSPHLDLHSLIKAADAKQYVPSLIEDDRVHPGNIAHALIAYHILESIGIKAPRLPLWDSSFTDAEKEVLRRMGIEEDSAPKNPFSDERCSAERRKAGFLYVTLTLKKMGISPAETDTFLSSLLNEPLEPWRRAAVLDYLSGRAPRREYDEAVRAALSRMYDAYR